MFGPRVLGDTEAGPGIVAPLLRAVQNDSTSDFSTMLDGDAVISAGPRDSRWHATYRSLLLVSDVTFVFIALLIAFLARFTLTNTPFHAASTVALVAGIAAVWLFCLYACDAYEVRRIATGPEEWRRIVRAGAVCAGLSVGACFYLRQDVARGYLAICFPLGIVLLAAGRLMVRRVVRTRRQTHDWNHRVLAVGSGESVRHLIASSQRASQYGILVVGACVDDMAAGSEIAPGVPVVGTVSNAARHIQDVDADVVALAGGGMSPHAVRELSWQLERTNCNVVAAHSMSEIASPRLHVIPLDGMPLLWVDQPRFTGMTRRMKRVFDVTAAAFALLLLSPLLIAVGLAVRLTSNGPMFFRQSRLGLDGKEFLVLKFRTMVVGAEARRAELLALNETDGALFKMTTDPRITSLGGWLRRLSIDELPQLLNVLKGDMSLVGPRPLATIDSNYTGHARRRLLVRPGITGLWQVSGRSNISWDEAVRMDLYYVENWSLGLDLSLIAKTMSAVLMRRGAY